MLGIFGIINGHLGRSSVVRGARLGELIHDAEPLTCGLIDRFTNTKFLEDKVFEGDADTFICLDGIIFNLRDLKLKLGLKLPFQILKRLYEEHGERFVGELRGHFCGCLYDKRENKWLIFTDPISSKPIFYVDDELFLFSSKIQRITKTLAQMGRKYRIDELGAYFLITYQFMLGNHTLISEIKKLKPGCYLRYSQNSYEIVSYHQFSGRPLLQASEDEIVDRVDCLFRNGIEAEYNKDLEYGYEHFATLSGGLDSRMTVMVAREMGFGPCMNLTFSQSNYWDELIAKQIAADLGNPFLFFALDGGNYLKNVHGPLLANDGLVSYQGAAHLFAALQAVNCSRYGLLHSGQLGDAVMGSYLAAPRHSAPDARRGAYSTRLLERISAEADAIARQYESEEIFLLYNRGFNGILNGNQIASQFTEGVASPFLMTEFLDYCLKIPPAFRYNHRMRVRWIVERHPTAANYIWAKTGAKPFRNRAKLQVNASRLWRGIQRRARRACAPFLTKQSQPVAKVDSMNPFQYWYHTNATLRDFIDSYVVEKIAILDDFPNLRQDCLKLATTGTCKEKLQVVSLLAALELHFCPNTNPHTLQ